MKLSRTGWNNVIIFSVMIIILLINATNHKLFPSESDQQDNSAEQLILPEHSVILTLEIIFSEGVFLKFERQGKHWQVLNEQGNITYNNQKIEQMMLLWQRVSGLVQASDIVISGKTGINVIIELANIEQTQHFVLYELKDQLLIFNVNKNQWLSLPTALVKQLLPLK